MQNDITFENPLLASAQRRRVDQMLRQDAGGVSGFGVDQRDGGTGGGFQPTDIAGMAEQVKTLASELQAQAMGSRMEDQRMVQRENATETGMMGVSGYKLRTLAQTKKHFDDTITELAESDHGRTPQVSNDGRDRVAGATPTYDIGYGHKIKATEHTSGKIHGITFKNQDGTFRTLTDQDIKDIYKADLKSHTDSIRAADWDEKLKDRSSSWAKLGQGYRLALSSLAYNVGNHTALSEWSAVFDAAIDNNPLTFAAELRRQDTRVKTHAELVTTLQAASPETPNIGEMSPEDLITTLTGMGRATTKKDYTAGTDNRVLREMFAAGFINSESDFDDIKAQLPEATDRYDEPNGYID